MGATSLSIASAAQHLVCAVIYLCSQFKMFRIHASRFIAFVTYDHPMGNLALVHQVRGSVGRHSFFSEPERTCATFAASGFPKPAPVVGHIVFIVKALLCGYFWSRVQYRILPRPMPEVVLSAKSNGLMFAPASFDRTFAHDASHSVFVIRNCITTPKKWAM